MSAPDDKCSAETMKSTVLWPGGLVKVYSPLTSPSVRPLAINSSVDRHSSSSSQPHVLLLGGTVASAGDEGIQVCSLIWDVNIVLKISKSNVVIQFSCSGIHVTTHNNAPSSILYLYNIKLQCIIRTTTCIYCRAARCYITNTQIRFTSIHFDTWQVQPHIAVICCNSPHLTNCDKRSATYTQMPPLVGPRCVTGLHTE